MQVTKDLLVELIYKALPLSENISKLNLSYYTDAISFEWRNCTYKVGIDFRCSAIEGNVLYSSDKCLLIERLIKKYYIDYLK